MDIISQTKIRKPDDIQVVILENETVSSCQTKMRIHPAVTEERKNSLESHGDESIKKIVDEAQHPTKSRAPIECDIYSLPLDNIPQVGSADPSAAIIDELTRHRFRKTDKSRNTQRHSIHIGESRESLETRVKRSDVETTSSANRGAKLRNSQSQRHQRGSLEVNIDSVEDRRLLQTDMRKSRVERNNNEDDEHDTRDDEKLLRGEAKVQSQRNNNKKRKSEIETSTDKIENTLPVENNANQHDQKQHSSHCKLTFNIILYLCRFHHAVTVIFSICIFYRYYQ